MNWLIKAVQTTAAVQRIVLSLAATTIVVFGVSDYIKERKKHGTRSRNDGVRK